MGFFGPSKQERKEAAERLTAQADAQTTEARGYKNQAAKVRKANQDARHPDPAATREITRQLDANRRIAEANARDLRAMAAQESKKWWQR
jgi:hypothetical protein